MELSLVFYGVIIWVLADLCRVQEGLRLLYAVASLFASLVAGPVAVLVFLLLRRLLRLFVRILDAQSPDGMLVLLLLGSIVLASAVFALTFRGLLMLAGKLFVRWQRITPAQYARFFCGRKISGLEQDCQQAGR